MALPKIEEVRSLSDEEVAEQILALKRQLFEFRLQQATRRLEKTHQFKHTKHRLGQLLTIEGERKRAAAAAAASTPAPNTGAAEEMAVAPKSAEAQEE